MLKEGQPQPVQENHDSRIADLNAVILKPEKIHVLLSLKPGDPGYPFDNGETFEANYESSTDFGLKYIMARSLLQDGKYDKPLLLLRKFIPAADIITKHKEAEDRQKAEEEIKSGFAQELKDRLRLLLVEKGQIKPGSEEDKDAQKALIRFAERDQILRQLMELLPIHVVGAITSAQMFENVTDEEKREKLRSWTTRALRPYLGDLLVRKPQGDINFRDIITLVPAKIFDDWDTATANIVRDHFERLAMGMFTESEEEGFSRLEDAFRSEQSESKRQFLQGVLDEFKEIRDEEIPPVFKDQVEGWFSPTSPFPLFRQKYFVHEFKKTHRKFLNGDTGATKTACADLAMESVGASRVTIFGPAKARNTWPREARKIYQEDAQPDVFAVISAKDLDNPRIKTAKQVYISSELMARAWSNPELNATMTEAVITNRHTDGIILDEYDVFRHQSAKSTKMLRHLVTQIQANNQELVPMIPLTATPLSSSLKDLDISMALLYPERFAFPKSNQDGKFTFSTLALMDPKIAYSLLYGEQLMIQWSLEDLFGEKAPKLDPKIVNLEMTASQYEIYQWVLSLPIRNPLEKIAMLRSVLLNPNIIKKTIREKGLIPEPVYDPAKFGEHLEELYNSWWEWFETSPDKFEPFSADWIAKFGDGQFLIQLFFDNRFADGIESLVMRYPHIRTDWQEAKFPSVKYEAIKKFLERTIIKTEDGYEFSQKTMIVSPFHKEGITRWFDDPYIRPEDLDNDAWSLYEMLRLDFSNLPNEASINIDGQKSFSARDRAAQEWRESGIKNNIVVASMRSIYQSMDWAIRDTEDNKNIEAMNVIFLGWPWGWDEFKQMSGRFLRPGQTKPVNIYILETENSIDRGFKDLVKIKDLLSQMALAGVELSKEDQVFFSDATSAKRILIEHPKVGQLFLYDAFAKLRGMSEEEMRIELAKEINGRTLGSWLAEFYLDEGNDEYRIVGNNAELVKNVVLREHPEHVLSVGSGTCIFARKIARTGIPIIIDNLDINLEVLQLAKQKNPEIGNVLHESATKISKRDGTYDAIECSFVLPLIKLVDNGKVPNDATGADRVKTLLEMNRVLKIGGTAVLTFPENSFNEESFARFTKALTRNFGFQVVGPTGVSFASDITPNKKLGWIITVRKINKPDLSNIDSEDLMFETDRDRISRYKGKKNGATVKVIDYPIFASKEFRIYNPLTREVATNKTDVVDKITVTPQELVELIKPNLSDSQREIWVEARRKIERGLDQNYSLAEQTLASIFARRRLDASVWSDEAVRKILDAEIRRLVRTYRTREAEYEGTI